MDLQGKKLKVVVFISDTGIRRNDQSLFYKSIESRKKFPSLSQRWLDDVRGVNTSLGQHCNT